MQTNVQQLLDQAKPANLRGAVEIGFAFLAVTVLILCFVVMGQEQVENDALYCLRVEQGAWPDYNHNYRQICGVNAPRSY